jgi:hypothetical protein
MNKKRMSNPFVQEKTKMLSKHRQVRNPHVNCGVKTALSFIIIGLRTSKKIHWHLSVMFISNRYLHSSKVVLTLKERMKLINRSLFYAKSFQFIMYLKH